jgi:predicted porin
VRKYLAILLGAVFILGFAASAFAIHAEIPADTQAVVTKGVQVTIGGDIRARGELQQNTLDFDDDKGDHYAAYDQRIRLWVDAQVTPNTKGLIMIEGAEGKASTGWNWGSDTNGSKGVYLKGDAKRGQLNVLEAWIQHSGSGLLGMPAGIKVGHMPLALGNKLFFDHTLFGDDAVVVFADPTKELHVGLLTIKFMEGDNRQSDDSTAYVGLFNYRTKEFGISGDVVYLDDQSFGSRTISPKGLHFWNFGLRGDVKVAGFGIKADVEVQTGKAKDANAPLTAFRKASGWAAMAGVNYTVSGIKLEAEYAYGSGDKPDTTDKFEGFVTTLSNVQHFTYVYDYRTTTAAGAQGTGLSNTQYIKAGLSGGITKGLSGELFYYYLKANKTASGVSKSLGNEIDAKVTYKIDKNLNYWVEGGYLITGNFYKTVSVKDPDNAYAVRHGIQLTF